MNVKVTFLSSAAVIFSALSAQASSYWSCQGTGEFANVSVDGAMGRSLAGPYTCIGSKRADSLAGVDVRADKAVKILLTNSSLPVTLERELGVNYYSTPDAIVKEALFLTHFKVAVTEWAELNSPEKGNFKDVEFRCRNLTSGYSSACSITDETTKNIVSGKLKPLTRAQLLKIIDYYFNDLAKGSNADKKRFENFLDYILAQQDLSKHSSTTQP